MQIQAEWSGPLPPPAALQAFEEVIPGGAERILAMPEREQQNRHANDTTALTCAVAEHKRGQVLGASILALAVIGSTLIGLFTAAPWQIPAAIVGMPVAGAVVALMRGRSRLQAQDED